MTDIRALAKAATPGPWTKSSARNGIISKFKLFAGVFYERDTLLLQTPRDEDAAYIAFMSPERVLAMQDVIDLAERAREYFHRINTEEAERLDVQLTAALARLQEIR